MTRHGSPPKVCPELVRALADADTEDIEDKLAGMRVIPLVIQEEKLQKAEQAAGTQPLLALKPYVRRTACIVSTGSEVKKGLIKDTGATVFDLLLPKIAADVPVTRADIAALGEGGLCLGCGECRYPVCPFGK